MYSHQVMDHFRNPRNAGELAGATARAEGVTNPVCGDVMNLAARVEDGAIAEVRFKCSGCVPAIAAGSALTELMQGQTLDELKDISDQTITEALGGLPSASRHAAQLAADALRALLKQAEA
jgi:NifU-like protein involved in Fe-S cluster formation